jgi:hypothetical protein
MCHLQNEVTVALFLIVLQKSLRKATEYGLKFMRYFVWPSSTVCYFKCIKVSRGGSFIIKEFQKLFNSHLNNHEVNNRQCQVLSQYNLFWKISNTGF